jgi:hypothetical protein
MPLTADLIKMTVITTTLKIWKQTLGKIKKVVWKLSRNGISFYSIIRLLMAEINPDPTDKKRTLQLNA